jgi:hypothetical protein
VEFVWSTEMTWPEVQSRSEPPCQGCRWSWEDIKLPCRRHATAEEDVERERRIAFVLKTLFGVDTQNSR